MRLKHRPHELVVGNALIGKPQAASIDGDRTWLGAIGHGVGEYAVRAITTDEVRDWGPEGILGISIPDSTAGQTCEFDAIPGIAWARRGERAGGVWEVSGAHLGTMRESSGCKHDAAVGKDFFAIGSIRHRHATDACTVADQATKLTVAFKSRSTFNIKREC